MDETGGVTLADGCVAVHCAGIRVPGFVHSPLLPKPVQGTVSTKLFHITDWTPTIVGLARGNTARNKPLDGFDIWAAIANPATPSPRTEILHNINPACGKGYVNPNAGLRVGDFKLLVECFNTTTLLPEPAGKSGGCKYGLKCGGSASSHSGQGAEQGDRRGAPERYSSVLEAA